MNFLSLSAFSIGMACHAFFWCGLSGPANAASKDIDGSVSVELLADANQTENFDSVQITVSESAESSESAASSVQAEDPVMLRKGLTQEGLTGAADRWAEELSGNLADSLIDTDWLQAGVDGGDADSDIGSRSRLAQSTSFEDLAREGSSTAADGLPARGPLEAYGQAVLLQENAETSGRLRGTVFYPLSDQWLLGAEADLTFGDAFSGDGGLGARLNELYAAYAPESVPELRFVAGLIDFTSYFDRNSFAKDKTTHFFNSVFETNPALSAVGIDSKPGVLVNWSPVDAVELKAAGFSSSRELGDLGLDSVALEAGLRWGNAIVRGTYSNSRDRGRGDGFEEIFQFDRGEGRFGLKDGDREAAYGINGELFIPAANLGLFGRYGHYRNLELDEGGDTFSFGLNWFDVGLEDSRLGLGYGRGLSQNDLRRDRGDKRPDVLELFYDFPIAPQSRVGVSWQQREEFSETVLGVRVKRLF